MNFYVFVVLASIWFGGMAFWAYQGCERVPEDVLTVGLIQGISRGVSSDAHEGFDWDIGFFLAQRLHKQLKTKAIWISDYPTALNDGTVDVISASMNITDARLKDVAMVHVYGKPSPYLTLLFWDQSYQKEINGNKHLRDIAAFFEKHSVGVVKGSVWEGILKQYEIKPIKTYFYEHNLVSGLQQGEVGAIVVGRVSADLLQRQNSNIWSLKVALDRPFSAGVGVAIKKENKELVKQVADVIQALKDEGMIDMLQLKWFAKVY